MLYNLHTVQLHVYIQYSSPKSPRIMLSGPLCQMSLHDSVLRLLISKFCHFFLMGLILKLADSMGGRYDHIISQYRKFYFTITVYHNISYISHV